MRNSSLDGKLSGSLLAGAFALASWGATNITADVTLDADADWRAAGQVTIAAGVTVDLNGHILKIAGLAGEGRITASATLPVAVPEVVTSQAMFWLDAADTSTLTIDGSGNVSAWRSKVGDRVATLETDAKSGVADVAPLYSADGFQLPCVDFGTAGSKKNLSYEKFTNIRTVFAVMKLQNQADYVAILTDLDSYDFFRGPQGQYFASFVGADSHIWNGTQAVDPWKDVIPSSDFQVLCLEMAKDSQSDTLAMDRPYVIAQAPIQANHNGGKQIAELIFF